MQHSTELDLDDPIYLIGKAKYWLFFSDGSVCPNVAGGAPDKGDDDDKGVDDGDDEGDDDEDDDPDDKGDDDPAEKLAKAEAEALKWKRQSRKHERELKALKGKKPAPSDDDKSKGDGDAKAAIDKAREEARAEVREATERRLKISEVKVYAAGKGVTNAKRLAKLVDLDDIEVNDDGEIDDESVREAVDDVLKEFPELAGKKPDDGGDDEGEKDDKSKSKGKAPAGEQGARGARRGGKKRDDESDDDERSIEEIGKSIREARRAR